MNMPRFHSRPHSQEALRFLLGSWYNTVRIDPEVQNPNLLCCHELKLSSYIEAENHRRARDKTGDFLF